MARTPGGDAALPISPYGEYFDELVAIGRNFNISRRDAEALAHVVIVSSIGRFEGGKDPGESLRSGMRYASTGYAAYRKAAQRLERV